MVTINETIGEIASVLTDLIRILEEEDKISMGDKLTLSNRLAPARTLK